jgi:hypothetical protein
MSDEYTRVGEPWLITEDAQLIQEYNTEKMSLMQIAKIHKRRPGGISSRLKRLNLVQDDNCIRGNEEYQQSDLYKELWKEKLEKREARREERKVKKENMRPTNKVMESIREKTELSELKKDVKEIKESLNKLMEMIQAIYEFESE